VQDGVEMREGLMAKRIIECGSEEEVDDKKN